MHPIVEDVLLGYNGTVMAYGQTGERTPLGCVPCGPGVLLFIVVGAWGVGVESGLVGFDPETWSSYCDSAYTHTGWTVTIVGLQCPPRMCRLEAA